MVAPKQPGASGLEIGCREALLISWEPGSYGPARAVLHSFAPYLSNFLRLRSLSGKALGCTTWLAVSLSSKRPWIMQADDLQVQPLVRELNLGMWL